MGRLPILLTLLLAWPPLSLLPAPPPAAPSPRAGYWQYTTGAALARWAELDGCRAGPLRRDLAADRYEQLYTACSAGSEVAGHITRGAGHVWTADKDAMWRFLSRYRRP